MNGKELLYKINDLDDDLVEQAENARKRPKIAKTAVLLAAAAVMLFAAVACVVSVKFNDVYEEGVSVSGYGHLKESIDALLDLSRGKTVKKNIVKTVTLEELASFGLYENQTYSAYQYDYSRLYGNPYHYRIDENGKIVAVPILHTTDRYSDIAKVEKNGFLKENANGELYTVFKTDTGAYVYCIMKVEPSNPIKGKPAVKVNFDRAYWVYGEVIKKEYFDGLEKGKTTKTEIDGFTEAARDYRYLTVLFQSGPQEKRSNYAFLVAEGVVTLYFEYNEEIGDFVLSDKEFTEGCPINPEDLI